MCARISEFGCADVSIVYASSYEVVCVCVCVFPLLSSSLSLNMCMYVDKKATSKTQLRALCSMFRPFICIVLSFIAINFVLPSICVRVCVRVSERDLTKKCGLLFIVRYKIPENVVYKFEIKPSQAKPNQAMSSLIENDVCE